MLARIDRFGKLGPHLVLLASRGLKPAARGLVFCFLMTILGCAPASLGVTSGGQEDIASARQIIENGGIPDPESITVEGFLSEHSIPVIEPDDPTALYATTSVAWNRDFDAFTPLATVQIGLGTTADIDIVERQPLNLCLVIDRSGSMGHVLDVRSGTTKLEGTKIAIDRLLAQLTPADRVSIVAFNEEALLRLEAVPGTDIAAIKTALDEIIPIGATDLVAGMRRGYRYLQDTHSDERDDRLFVFTDAIPTVRVDEHTEELLDLMRGFAEDEFGATLVGVGNEFGEEIAYDISQIRGGNFVFLNDYDRILTVFDEEFKYLVTPIAYDIDLQIEVPFLFDVVAVYGIPSEAPYGHSLTLRIPTLFYSVREGGAILFVRLRPSALADFSLANELAQVSLSYETPEGGLVTRPALVAVLPAGQAADASTPYYDPIHAKRATLLLNTVLVIRAASEDVYEGPYGGYYYYSSLEDVQRAIERLTDFLLYFDEMAVGLEDQVSETSRTLSQERALVQKLLQNVTSIRVF